MDIIIKSLNSSFFKIHKNNSSNKKIMDIKKLSEEKDRKLKELQEKYEKEHNERNEIEIKLMTLKQDLESVKGKNFIEKNEVIKIWEKFALNDIKENFQNFLPIEIYHLISNLFYLSKEILSKLLIEKYNLFLNCFNLESNKQNLESIEKRLKPFILNNISEIIFNEKDSLLFLNTLKKDFEKYSLEMFKNKNKKIEILINQSSFKYMIENIKKLILFGMFNEPILNFNIEKKFDDRKIEIIKINKSNINHYLIVNNIMEKQEFNAIIILNPPITKSGIEIAKLNNLKKIIIINENKSYSNLKDERIYEIDLKKILKNTIKWSDDISIKKKNFYEIYFELDSPIISQIGRIRKQYKNKIFDRNKENIKESFYNLYMKPLSQRVNKSLNHKSINAKKYNIDGESNENEYILTDLNDEKILDNNIKQIKNKDNEFKINKKNRKKITYNDLDFKKILNQINNYDFSQKLNKNKNIYYQARTISEMKNNKSNQKSIVIKKDISKRNNKEKAFNSNYKNFIKTNINLNHEIKKKKKKYYDEFFSSPYKKKKKSERPSTVTTKSSTYFNIDIDISVNKKDYLSNYLNIINLNQTNRIINQFGCNKKIRKFFSEYQLNDSLNNLNKNELNKYLIFKIVKNDYKNINKNNNDKNISMNSLLKLKKLFNMEKPRTKSPND